MHRIGGEQPVNGGGAGARQSGHEDRPLGRDVGVLRVLLERRLGHQPGDQRVADEEPLHLAAEFGQVGVAAKRLEQHGERLAVVVVVDAEVVEAGGLHGRRMQVLDGADIGSWRAAL